MTRATLTRLADAVVMSAPSPRIRVIFDNAHGPQHTLTYLGFDDAAAADACYAWLAANELVGKYNRKTGSGACKPRFATRVDGATVEIKIHSLDPEILAQAIRRDLARAAVAA